MEFLWFLLTVLTAGWMAGIIMKGDGFGLAGDLVIGVLGALVGGFLFHVLGINAYGLLGSLVMATIGALMLVALLQTFRGIPRVP